MIDTRRGPVGCSRPPEGRAFGTRVSVLAFHSDAAVAEAAARAALDAMLAVDLGLSLYRPESALSRLNRDGVLSPADPDLLAVLTRAEQVSYASRGAFDVTVQPLWRVHPRAAREGRRRGLGRDLVDRRVHPRAAREGRLPSDAEVAAARAKVDWRGVRIEGGAVRLARPGMAVTLNGIAQGLAADRALAALRAHGVEHALVDAGEQGGLGARPDGSPWTVGIQHPRREDAFVDLARLDGRCLATSGDCATTFSEDRSRHHLFDPATGVSPGELSSVTVVADRGMDADWAGCDPSCNNCGQVCPTGAIRALPIEEKRAARMGLAVVDEETCLPHAGRGDCRLCVDECDVAGYGAIEFQRVGTELDENDEPIPDTGYLAPVVRPDRCVGCGLCQMRCYRVNSVEKSLLERTAIEVEAGEGKEDRLSRGSYVELRRREAVAREERLRQANEERGVTDDYLPDFLRDR